MSFDSVKLVSLEQVTNDRNQTFNVSWVNKQNDGKGKQRNRGPFKGKKGKDKDKNKRKREGDQDDDEITDRYYSPKEYQQLTKSQKAKVQELRDKRDRQAAAALTQLAAMQVQISQLQAAAGMEPNVNNDLEEEAHRPTGTNRTNAALQRKPKGQ